MRTTWLSGSAGLRPTTTACEKFRSRRVAGTRARSGCMCGMPRILLGDGQSGRRTQHLRWPPWASRSAMNGW